MAVDSFFGKSKSRPLKIHIFPEQLQGNVILLQLPLFLVISNEQPHHLVIAFDALFLIICF